MEMKAVIIILLLFCNIVQAQEHALHSFNIIGTIIGKDSGYVYLNYVPAGQHGVMDSCLIKNGSFILKGEVAEPTKAFFVTASDGKESKEDAVADLYVEPGTMHLVVNAHQFKNLQLTGSAADSDYRRLLAMLNPIKEKGNAARESLRKWEEQYKNDPDNLYQALLNKKEDSIQAVQNKLTKEWHRAESTFIAQNLTSYVAADLLATANSDWLSFASVEHFFAKFPTHIQESFPGKKIKYRIEKEQNLSIGSSAKNFTAIDSEADTISLSNYKDKKYVLLDFGASWCVPCRAITPELKKYYDKYKANLEIISIAHQNEIEDWKKSVREDNTEWPHIIENDTIKAIEPAATTISDTYTIDLIPSLVLIDKHGLIIGKYGGGFYSSKQAYIKDLQESLQSIFGY